MSDDNENNLVQRREERRTLEKMRRKLATSGHMGKNNISKVKQQTQKTSTLRIWPFAGVAVALLLGLNFLLRTQEDKLLSTIGVQTTAKTALAPPAAASLDDQARFWAYAVYDIPKLKAAFKLPKAAIIDKVAARSNLERLLAENLGDAVRNEIFTMQQKAAPVPAPAAAAAAAKKRIVPLAPAKK